MSMLKLTIDGREVEVEPGQSIWDGARKLGVDIPTLCFLEQCTPATSCFACVVKLKANGVSRLVPSCATKAQPGMVIESETTEIHEARRTAMELLLSDHVGDCQSPCHRICPLHLNVPVMFRLVETGQLDEAIITLRDSLPLPGVLGRLCNRPCENGCRRGTWDQPAAIRDIERFVADATLKSGEVYLASCKPATGKSVVIVGSGPTGLAAAFQLRRTGHACTVIDRHERAGGSLRSQTDEKTLPREVLEKEIDLLRRIGVQFRFGIELGNQVSLEGLQRGFDAILLALGETTKDEAQKIGLPTTATGVKVDANTSQIHLPHLFASGSLVKLSKQVARAMSEGQAVAVCIDHFLTGREIHRPDKEFSSIMGRLEEGEVDLFVQHASPRGRVTASGGDGLTDEEAKLEAARCVHCDCRAAGSCKLQCYAARYEADPGRFRAQRRRFDQLLHPGGVLYEPGKCILCGICVQLTEKAREPLGLTFIGRGFDVRVAAPLNGSISEGLQKVAADCVEHCPTGALVNKCDKICGAQKSAPQSHAPSHEM